jgi:hypothetical protein
MADFQTVETPVSGIYRVGFRTPGPFVPADWSRAIGQVSFSGRFDDPRAGLPEQDRFRVLYCASDRRGAFGETLARFRLPVRLTSRLDTVDDDEPISTSYSRATDPNDPSRGLVTAEWRLKRAMGHTFLERGLPFVDLGSSRTLQRLRSSIDVWTPGTIVRDIDLSLVMGPGREFTQRISRHIYEQRDELGAPLFAGIRYISRLDQNWECWAVFADRMHHAPGMPGLPETIFPDDPDLLEIASIFRLTIETIDGSGHYYRP